MPWRLRWQRRSLSLLLATFWHEPKCLAPRLAITSVSSSPTLLSLLSSSKPSLRSTFHHVCTTTRERIGVHSPPRHTHATVSCVHTVNYNWVLGVSLAKSVLWIAASVVTIIVSRRHKEKVALAGIRAIFCVQSNDLALGVPIVMALYGRTHPEYVGYLFILQPVTLCFLDPMGSLTLCKTLAYTPLSRAWCLPHPLTITPGFLLIECGIQHRHRSKSGKRGGACWAVLRVLKRVVTNPIVMVVFLGLIWNLAVRRPLPGIVALTLKVRVCVGRVIGFVAWWFPLT